MLINYYKIWSCNNISIGALYEQPKETQFAAGDRIKVELDPDVWRAMQDGHGGWNELMAMVSTCRLACMHECMHIRTITVCT